MKKKTLTNDKRNKYFKNWLKKILPFQNPVLCLLHIIIPPLVILNQEFYKIGHCITVHLWYVLLQLGANLILLYERKLRYQYKTGTNLDCMTLEK